MCLLFIMAHWHGLAKLRLHTDETLDILKPVTVLLGDRLRDFQENTCSAFATTELKKEADSRSRRQSKSTTVTANTGTNVRRAKIFNLNTYKFHSLGDYTETILNFGTTDSYSTEMVSGINFPMIEK
jgi:hypothetical protein